LQRAAAIPTVNSNNRDAFLIIGLILRELYLYDFASENQRGVPGEAAHLFLPWRRRESSPK
jgi:hypothetical protein